MELKTVQSHAFKSLCDTLKDIVFDVPIIFNKKGVFIKAMDVNKAAFIYMKLDKDKFDEYECDKEYIVGVNMANMHKFMKTINHSDNLILRLDPDDTSKLGIEIENDDKGANTKYKLKLLEIDQNLFNMPKTEFDSETTLESKKFNTYCREFSDIDDDIVIMSHKDKITLYADGDIGERTTELDSNTEGLRFKKTSDTKTRATYELKYLKSFSKSFGLSPHMNIYIKAHHPIILEYNVMDLGTIKFCLSEKEEFSDDED